MPSGPVPPPFKPGEPFRPKAEWHNVLRDMTTEFLDGRVAGDAGIDADPGVVRIHNSTASPMLIGQAVGMGDPVADPTAGDRRIRPTLEARVPLAGDALQFGIIAKPAPAGVIGRAVVTGMATALVTINDEAHTYAAIAAGSLQLSSSAAAAPARIWWKQDPADRAVAGTAICVVSINQTAAASSGGLVLGTITAASVVGTGAASTINYSASGGGLSVTGAVPLFRPVGDDATDGDFPMRAAAVGSACVLADVGGTDTLLMADEHATGDEC